MTYRSPQTQQIILTALAKISMHPGADDDLRTRLGMLFRQHASSKEVELQQRAVEYFVMTNVGGNAERLRSVMEPMPEWNTQSRQSKLERSLATQNAQAADAVGKGRSSCPRVTVIVVPRTVKLTGVSAWVVGFKGGAVTGWFGSSLPLPPPDPAPQPSRASRTSRTSRKAVTMSRSRTNPASLLRRRRS